MLPQVVKAEGALLVRMGMRKVYKESHGHHTNSFMVQRETEQMRGRQDLPADIASNSQHNKSGRLSWWARASSIQHMHYTYKHLLSTYCVLDSQQPKPNKTSVYPWEGVRSVLHEDKTGSGHVC